MRIKNISVSVIAHIDHGKSTLLDRIIEISSLIKNVSNDQILDNMDLEREKGVTIKMHPISFDYKNCKFNFIDTPGHDDFTSETILALQNTDVALVLVDALQWMEAQTFMVIKYAKQYNCKIIPIINKIDLLIDGKINEKNINFENIKEYIKIEYLDFFEKNYKEYERLFNFSPLLISAKEGIGVQGIMDILLKESKDFEINQKENFVAQIIESNYDKIQGIYMIIKVKSGYLSCKEKKVFINNKGPFLIKEIGYNTLKYTPSDRINKYDIGYILVKTSVSNASIGNIISLKKNETEYKNEFKNLISQKMFLNIYPLENKYYEKLKDAISKLSINDYGFTYSNIKYDILGKGFLCGFLGQLHSEIILERIRRNYLSEFFSTKCKSHIKLKGEIHYEVKDLSFKEIANAEMPFFQMNLRFHNEYYSKIIKFLESKLFECEIKKIKMHLNDVWEYDIEVFYNDLMEDLYSKLKSLTNGNISIFLGNQIYKKTKDKPSVILVSINNTIIKSLSYFDLHDRAMKDVAKYCLFIKEKLSKQQYQLIVNIIINNRKVARETIQPFRKDVTGKCYGGDVTRKKKLLQKQNKGKKLMLQKSQGQASFSRADIINISKIKK